MDVTVDVDDAAQRGAHGTTCHLFEPVKAHQLAVSGGSVLEKAYEAAIIARTLSVYDIVPRNQRAQSHVILVLHAY